MSTLTVPARHCGPPASGNGGWTAGALAARLVAARGLAEGAPVTVSLRTPPPLDRPLDLRATDDGGLAAYDADTLVAAAVAATADPRPVEAVGLDAARTAEASYAGLAHHPFPTCFACGTAREPGDGLRIFPGRVDGGRVAATWMPADDADTATVWAAVDCVGAWAAEIENRAIVLGRMTARVVAPPEPSVDHVVVGEVRGEDGRKVHTAASLLDPSGALVATAEHTWITVDPATFGYAG